MLISAVEQSEWVKSLSRVRLFVTPWTVAYQASPSTGFSRQEYLSGLPFPSPGDLPYPGIKPASPALAGRFFTPSATREARMGVISSSSCRNPMKELLLFCGCYNNPMAWTNRNALSQVLESRSPKSRYWQGSPLLEALDEEGLFFASLGFWWLQAFHGLWAAVTPVSAFIFASVSQISLTLSLKGHLPFDLWSA